MSQEPQAEGHQRARMHHLIPESFLLRFAGGDGLLLVTDKREGTRKAIAPRVLMTQRDYYTIETVEGPSDVVEKWLGGVEGAAAEALRRIEGGQFPPNEEDLGVLSVFIALQLLRGPKLQEMLEDMSRKVTEMGARLLASVPDAMRAAMLHAGVEDLSDEEVKQQQDYLMRALEDERITTTVPREATIDAMLYAVPAIANVVSVRSWDLYECERPAFITGDVPVAMWSPPLPDGRPMPTGFATAQEITFAIDPRRFVLLGPPRERVGVRYAVPADSRAVQVLNERHYVYARRFTFQHPDDPFVFDVERAREHQRR